MFYFLVLISLISPFIRTRTEAEFFDFIFRFFTWPPSHCMEISYPPRAFKPDTFPEDQAFGTAGNNSIKSGVDCTNISATAAEPPKKPWKLKETKPRVGQKVGVSIYGHV